MRPPGLGVAVGYGAFATALGSLVLLVVGVPAAVGGLLAMVVPAILALGLALAQPGRRAAWLRAALGLLLGSVLCVVVVLGLITGVAYLLSDPA